MSTKRAILVVAGIGNGSGTGASAARIFAKAGYRVAVIARNPEHVEKVAQGINSTGGEAAAFPVKAYDYGNIHAAFDAIKKHWANDEIRVAVWNANQNVRKGFLDITEQDIQESVDVNIVAAFAFSREAILSFKDLPLNEHGKRGTLIFTSATAAWRGNLTTSAFAAGKYGARALSQSLNKEFGKQNIHVSNVIIDGGIITDLSRARRGDKEWEANEDVRLNPDSIAESYLYLAKQDRSAWTWELDLRPAHEKW